MNPTRRQLLAGLAAVPALTLVPRFGAAQPGAIITRTIPSSGEQSPAIGMGTWITFDVAGEREQAARTEIMRRFFAAGGSHIDSSPMYGRAQAVIGRGLAAIGPGHPCFAATKVWIMGAGLGRGQMEQAMELWGVDRFDLIHVHNMVDWQGHLPWLREWQQEGRLRYVGITTSHGRRHGAMEQVIREQPFDVVQFSYNIANREAEQRLLPAARDHGKAVIINRPFRGGALFPAVRGAPLPGWAAEIGAANWAQAFLKWVISHPAVTTAIPATSQLAHIGENMGALAGPLPDGALRQRMAADFDRLT